MKRMVLTMTVAALIQPWVFPIDSRAQEDEDRAVLIRCETSASGGFTVRNVSEIPAASGLVQLGGDCLAAIDAVEDSDPRMDVEFYEVVSSSVGSEVSLIVVITDDDDDEYGRGDSVDAGGDDSEDNNSGDCIENGGGGCTEDGG